MEALRVCPPRVPSRFREALRLVDSEGEEGPSTSSRTIPDKAVASYWKRNVKGVSCHSSSLCQYCKELARNDAAAHGSSNS